VPDQVTNVAFIVLIGAFAATGLLIFWRRPDDRAAMLFSLMLMTGGVVPIRQEWALEGAVPWLELPVRFVWLLAMFLWLVVFFVFPDGRFVPRWTRLLGAAAIPAAVLLVDLPELLVELPDVSARLGLGVLVWSMFCGAGLYAQAHRYRHVSGPVQRQQTKWVALPLGLLFLVVLFGIFIPTLFGAPDAWLFWALLVEVAVMLLFPTSVAVAILRHHLYDIDRIISRTVAFTLLTGILGPRLRRHSGGPRPACRRRLEPGRRWRHAGRRRPVPAAAAPCAAGRGPSLQPAPLRRGQDHRGVQHATPRAARPRHALGRAAGRSRPDDPANQGVAVAWTPTRAPRDHGDAVTYRPA
jgi:hypothetical protein